MLKCGWGLGVALVIVGCTEVVLPLPVKIERVPPNPHEMEQEAFEEEDAEWRVHHWGNDGTITPVLRAGKGVPNKVMRLTCQAGDLESVEFTRDVRIKLKSWGKAHVDLYNKTRVPLGVAFALHTSRHLTFYEGVMHELKPGRWTRLEVKLGLRDWRSEESDATRIKKTNDVRMLSLLVFNGMLNATLYMDNFTWDHVKKEEKKKLE